MLDMQQGLVYYPPYRGPRYHLKEYKGAREPESPKKLFNLRHSSLRTTVERAFGTLKNHFKIFASQPFFSLKTQVKRSVRLADKSWLKVLLADLL